MGTGAGCIASSAGADTLFTAEIVSLTSAFGDPTRREAWLFTRGRGERGATATEVSEHLGLHPNVARHHLDKLAAATYLEVFVARLEGAAAGRPSKHYRVPAGAGIDHATAIGLTTRRDELVLTLLGRALALVPPKAAQAMAEEVGEEYGRRLAADFVPGHTDSVARSFRAALHAVADALTAHGFSARAQAGPSTSDATLSSKERLTLVASGCPFGEAASQHPVLCSVDRGLIRGMLAGLGVDAEAAQHQSRALGDDRCVTAVFS